MLQTKSVFFLILYLNCALFENQETDKSLNYRRSISQPNVRQHRDTIYFPQEYPTLPERIDTPTQLSISEQKCQEYKKEVTETVGILPLLPFEDPINVEVIKCDYNSLPLIVGGSPAQPKEFPHMAAIGFPNEHNGIDWNCGGTLISNQFILTAAHCTSLASGVTPTVVRLGELNVKNIKYGVQPADYDIDRIIRNPNHHPPLSYNDIALLRLKRTVIFNDFIRPACLWTKHELTHSKVVATGWGKIDYAEDESDDLLKVVLSIIDNQKCKELYGTINRTLPRGLISSMMCAGELKGGKDTCQGDSGGPITVSSPENNCLHYIVGITSFGKACGFANAPGVYTRVSSFIPWIEKVVWG